MKFDIYGRFVIEVTRERGRWVAYRAGQGVRRPESSLAIPSALAESGIAGYLDDVYHEYALPGRTIRRIG